MEVGSLTVKVEPLAPEALATVPPIWRAKASTKRIQQDDPVPPPDAKARPTPLSLTVSTTSPSRYPKPSTIRPSPSGKACFTALVASSLTISPSARHAPPLWPEARLQR